MDAGFAEREVGKAFDWLEGLAGQKDNYCAAMANSAPASRIYHDREQAKLDTKCRGFLLFLEQAGVLGAWDRELVSW